MKKILLIDDNEEFLYITSLFLAKEYEIIKMSTTTNLVEVVTNFNPDLIIIDHFIGTDNSKYIIENIKTKLPLFNVPLILFSACEDLENKAKSIGAVGFIEKPSSISYIRSYVAGFFASKN